MKKFSIRTAGRSLFLSMIAITFLAFGASSARADEVTISGSTTGTVSGVPRLTFTGSPNFTVTTTLGVGSLIGLNNNLGTFTLSIAGLGQAQSVAGSFTLNITFTGPAGIAGGQDRSFNANLTGTISPFVGIEGVLIDFDNTPVVFTFNDGVNSGSFTLALPDVLIPSGSSGGQLTARITGSQTAIPEPATLFLLGTGLIGVAASARRRHCSRLRWHLFMGCQSIFRRATTARESDQGYVMNLCDSPPPNKRLQRTRLSEMDHTSGRM